MFFIGKCDFPIPAVFRWRSLLRSQQMGLTCGAADRRCQLAQLCDPGQRQTLFVPRPVSRD